MERGIDLSWNKKETITIIPSKRMNDIKFHETKKEEKELMLMMENKNKSEFADLEQEQHKKAMHALIGDLRKMEKDLVQKVTPPNNTEQIGLNPSINSTISHL